MERLVRVETCCCCCSLRTGSKVIGWMGLIGGLLVFLITLTGIIYLDEVSEGDDRHEQLAAVVTVILWAYLIGSVFGIVFDVILLIGVHQEKQKYVKLYVQITAALTVVLCILLLINIFFNGDANSTIKMMASLAIQVYYLMVVNSYYYTMPGVGPESYA